jgi:hypothetical protein
MSMFFRNVALLAAVGIVSVVLFPAVCGPFTATNPNQGTPIVSEYGIY